MTAVVTGLMVQGIDIMFGGGVKQGAGDVSGTTLLGMLGGGLGGSLAREKVWVLPR